jgi:hypothetical protein
VTLGRGRAGGSTTQAEPIDEALWMKIERNYELMEEVEIQGPSAF